MVVTPRVVKEVRLLTAVCEKKRLRDINDIIKTRLGGTKWNGHTWKHFPWGSKTRRF